MVRIHLRASVLIAFLIGVKILTAGHTLTFGSAKESYTDQEGDKHGCTQMRVWVSNRSGADPTPFCHHPALPDDTTHIPMANLTKKILAAMQNSAYVCGA